MSESTKLPTRAVGGHKAAMHNPNISEEAKEHSRQVVDDLERDLQTKEQRAKYDDDKDETRVNAGLKATMKNPNVSQEAKDRAHEQLEDKGVF
ncbi:uncharacterized protein PHACADRAFT_214017 [Phanerochaete carnosa HHB-10118-sp]|uniref:Conidiation protein 6 n=1 Tax=Phanerochaete carnosa (strain HHB-10118-sp) TaxID=650164 RepID=K5WJC4_PHACS|nr:uncharacterized protein PHACADRAFT_214017 [Phanerochaete carnosa HHB-10118-sp]EKM50317.1 hypothetical protein PHACADRAFT_214017 [Phanerochaete carnosa HHB-10118-sp]